MARKLEDDLEVPEKAESKPSKKASNGPRKLNVVKVSLYTFIAIVLIGSGLYALNLYEKFLILDTRFALNGADGAEDNGALSIAGATYSSPADIQSVFRDDLGKSIYVLPLNTRRENLRQVSWVKDASVARLWPNRVQVRVWERTPVARVPAGNSFQWIDEEGVILPPVSARFRLPVLRGVSGISQPERRERVRRMLRLRQEIGEANAVELAEIDVADRDNVKVSRSYGEHVLTLLLGDHNFAARYQNFKQHYEEIRRRLPDAVTLDLRLEDRITVVQ